MGEKLASKGRRFCHWEGLAGFHQRGPGGGSKLSQALLSTDTHSSALSIPGLRETSLGRNGPITPGFPGVAGTP